MTKETASGITLKYIPQIFAETMTGVNRKDFPAQGSGTANFKEGIPSIYSVAPSAGGKYVERADINGIGWLATQLQYNLQVGRILTFDQEFCNTIKGYPFGAILQMESKEVTKGSGDEEKVVAYQSGLLMSLSDGNTTDFNDEANASCIVDTPYDPENMDNSYINQSYLEDGTTKYRWLRISANIIDVLSLKESDASIIEAMNKKDAELEASIEAVSKVASKAYHYKGSVPTVTGLETVTGVDGDVYNVADTGDNYAYIDKPDEGHKDLLYGHWDTLGKMFDLDTLKSDTTKEINDAKEECNKATDEALTDAKKYTDDEIIENCVLTSNVVSEEKTAEVVDNDVYSVSYLNTKFSDITTSSAETKKNLEDSINKAQSAAEAAQSAADGAQSTADEATKAAEDNLKTAKTYADDAVKTLADGAVKEAKDAADTAQSAADNAQETADTATKNAQSALDALNPDIESGIVAKILDRLSALETKVASIEEWIKNHDTTASTAEV